MAEGQENQGGGQGYTDNDIEMLLNETAKRAATEALKGAKQSSRQPRQPRDDEEIEDELIGMSPKLVKQLQTTVSVFNTLKEFSSNPLQKAIETKVGELAAGVVENAFSRPSGPPPKKDIIDTILNSQFAYGLGSGLGQRAPELVESMGNTFGKDRAEQMIDSVIGKYGKGQGGPGGQQGAPGGQQGGSRQLGTHGSGPSGPAPEQRQQTEKELLLSLDPNNPEHVAAYAESQGGISVDVARKMLMIHQDEFIKQMKNQGTDVSQLSTMRGSRTEKPVQQDSDLRSREDSDQHKLGTVQQDSEKRDSERQDTMIGSSRELSRTVPKMEYTDFQDVPPPAQPISPTVQYPETNPPIQDGQQIEIMKQFADDIEKVMGDVVNKIEAINNTVFVLQNEMNEMKRKSVPIVSSPSTSPPVVRMQEIVASPVITHTSEMERTAPNHSQIKRSEDFFEENIRDTGDFLRELEEEAKKDAKKLEGKAIEKEDKEELQIKQPPVRQPPIQIVPTPVQPIPSPTIRPIQEVSQDAGQKIEESNIVKPGEIVEEITEDKKDKDIENKRIVRPIKKANIRKNISISLFESDSQLKRNKDSDEDKTDENII